MRSQRAERAQMQSSTGNALKRARKSPTHASRRNSPPSRAFTERFDAIRKHRREPELQVQHALLELRQVRQHLRCQLVALPNQRRQPRQKLRIPQSLQSILVIHCSGLTREILSLALPSRQSFARGNGFKVDRVHERTAARTLAPTTPQIQETSLVDVAVRPKPVNNKQHSNHRNQQGRTEQVARAPPSARSPSIPRMRAPLARPHDAARNLPVEPTPPQRRPETTHAARHSRAHRDEHALRLHRWSLAASSPAHVEPVLPQWCAETTHEPRRCRASSVARAFRLHRWSRAAHPHARRPPQGQKPRQASLCRIIRAAEPQSSEKGGPRSATLGSQEAQLRRAKEYLSDAHAGSVHRRERRRTLLASANPQNLPQISAASAARRFKLREPSHVGNHACL